MARVTTTGSAANNNFNADNGTGLQVRTKINEVFSALRTINSGSGDPVGIKNVVAFQPHIDTSTNLLKICTAVTGSDDNATGTFTTIGNITQTNFGLLPKSGGTLTGVLTAATGSTSAPSLNFGDGGTGFHKKSTNVIGLVANQAEVAFFDQNSLTIDNQKELRILEDSGSQYVALAVNSLSANRTITLPDQTGTLLTTASSITNGNLANSSVTVGSTAISLGASATTINGIATLTATNLQATDLNITNVLDGSGNNGSTPEQIQKGRAKAWVIFGPDGSMFANFGVSSVTDNATGNFTVNFATAFATVNYAWALGYSRGTSNNGRMIGGEGTTGKTTTQFQMKIRNKSDVTQDTAITSAIFFAA